MKQSELLCVFQFPSFQLLQTVSDVTFCQEALSEIQASDIAFHVNHSFPGLFFQKIIYKQGSLARLRFYNNISVTRGRLLADLSSPFFFTAVKTLLPNFVLQQVQITSLVRTQLYTSVCHNMENTGMQQQLTTFL